MTNYVDQSINKMREDVEKAMTKIDKDREKAEAYDKLVEALRRTSEEYRRLSEENLLKREVFVRFAQLIEQELPPHPPKHEEVPWWQAIEGLKSGKYVRARPLGKMMWVGWLKHAGLVHHETKCSPDYSPRADELGTWRAELAS